MSRARIRVLLVDDEILARLAVRQALASHPQLDIVGECGNASEARQAIAALSPDLLFLDIQMPGMDGFELLRSLATEARPYVVFTTAHDQHALRAFDADAIDYLLKPIDQQRFDRAIARVMAYWQGPPRGIGAPAETKAPPLQRLSIRVGEHLRVVRAEEIDWIRADGNYVHIHVADGVLLHRENLGALEAMLDPRQFLRIHRGTLVNLDRVREVHPLFQGGAEVVLRDGTRLSLSRRYRERTRQALGQR